MGDTDDDGDPADPRAAPRGPDGHADVAVEYYETEAERVLAFERGGRTAVLAQNRDGYAMVAVRPAADGAELERYYGLEMALDHAAERLGVPPGRLPVPDEAADMGM